MFFTKATTCGEGLWGDCLFSKTSGAKKNHFMNKVNDPWSQLFSTAWRLLRSVRCLFGIFNSTDRCGLLKLSCSTEYGCFRKLHPVWTFPPSIQVSLQPELYHPNSSASSAAGEREKSQPCSNSHAAGAANTNRDIGGWMQAWSQSLFCSWRGLCLIGIGHAE